jgi:drug/metabolite transporter (DMT)-like permease
MWALSDVLSTSRAVFWHVQECLLFTLAAGCLLCLLYFAKVKINQKHMTGLGFRAWSILSVTFVSGILGSIAVAYALTLGKASLTTVFAGLQPLFAFIFGVIFVSFIKEIPKESMTRSDIIFKALSLVFILAGLIYLNYPVN